MDYIYYNDIQSIVEKVNHHYFSLLFFCLRIKYNGWVTMTSRDTVLMVHVYGNHPEMAV